MHQGRDVGFMTWFRHHCFSNSDFPVSRLWWQRRNVFMSYVGPRWGGWNASSHRKRSHFWGRSISQNMEGQQGIPRGCWKRPRGSTIGSGLKGSCAESEPTFHPHLWAQLPVEGSFCVHLTPGSGEKDGGLEKAILSALTSSHEPSQAIMPLGFRFCLYF